MRIAACLIDVAGRVDPVELPPGFHERLRAKMATALDHERTRRGDERGPVDDATGDETDSQVRTASEREDETT